ncbi:hypothetical protein EXU57_06215 [Segetibacter sp. 3557_3]|uniref:tetratricopeptide repeat protein n=1 Tax=Segetibacter sp. 3557_3 TaxID=2547429 RepID=UPI001058F00F|nr:hypothetical protein [Segetibacter sp. 3557_3]TDH28054.1 hypothetical protein EXU57_06215 [Segetibacter sp. 3557_3]
MKTGPAIYLMLFLVLSVKVSKAQPLNIQGDTVYVHTNFPVELRFPSTNSILRWLASDPAYKTEPTSIGFSVRAINELASPAVLLVTEGPGQIPRQHRFIIVYKKELKQLPAETVKDWSTKERLQKHIDELARKRPRESQNTAFANAGSATPDSVADNAPDAYRALIKQADEAYENKKYSDARKLYLQASDVQSQEVYPVYQLIQIARILESPATNNLTKTDSIAAAAKANRNFEATMQKAEAAFSKNDLVSARSLYMHALQLKPTEIEPKERLQMIIKRIAEQAQRLKYDSALAKGGIALSNKQYDAALRQFREALRIKPGDNYALNQVKWIESVVVKSSSQQAEKQKAVEFNISEEMYRKRFEEGMRAYSNYEKAAQLADYELQLHYLKQFLNIIPDNSLFNRLQYSEDPIGFAKNKIKTIRDYLTRTKGSQYQVEAIPFSNQELESKYANINFGVPPPEQLYDADQANNGEEKVAVCKTLLANKPNLQLSDSANNIKVVCEAISKKGSDAYFVLRLRNSGSSEFISGPVILTQQKKDKTTIHHKAGYISAFPIVLPGKEFSMVYQTKYFQPDKSDVLRLELADRLMKQKFSIRIPATTFEAESAK